MTIKDPDSVDVYSLLVEATAMEDEYNSLNVRRCELKSRIDASYDKIRKHVGRKAVVLPDHRVLTIDVSGYLFFHEQA